MLAGCYWWISIRYVDNTKHVRLTEMLKTFPRVFCFQSRVSTKIKQWRCASECCEKFRFSTETSHVYFLSCRLYFLCTSTASLICQNLDALIAPLWSYMFIIQVKTWTKPWLAPSRLLVRHQLTESLPKLLRLSWIAQQCEFVSFPV